MNLLKYFLCNLVIFIDLAICSKVLRPRGVSLQKSSLYDPGKEFVCFDGSAKIPFKYVNDDYCDCRDGSDEPGTAACPNGTFFCNNAGHKSIKIPSSRVNDGICDCCDASDEYGSKSDCQDVCMELGRAAREEAKRAQEEQQKGFQIKQQMITQAQTLKKEKEERLEALRQQQEQAQSLKDEKEQLKKTAEEPENEALEMYRQAEQEEKERQEAERKMKNEEEAEEAFQNLDKDEDGFLSVDEIQSHKSFDTNRDGEVSLEEAKFYLQQEEQMSWETFLANGWQLMRPVYLLDARVFTPPTPNPPAEEEELQPPPIDDEQQDGEQEIDESENEEDMGDEDLEEEEEEEEEEGPEEPEELEQEPPKAEPPRYDEQTQQLVDAANAARKEFEEAEKAFKDIQKNIEDLEGSLNKDYGPNDEFRVMEGQCFDFNDREYTYTLCPFDKAVQKSKNGYGEVRLGVWGEWVGTDDKYSAMKYTNGQTCWNGPQRTAEVQLSCGTENQLTAVSEPNRCEYLYQFITPAACVQTNVDEHIHTEL